MLKLLEICLAMIDDEAEQRKFEELYLEYKNLLFYRANQLLHDEYRAEDAVSKTFFHIAANMHKVDEAVSARTKRLLITIVERTAINMYNKYQKEYNRTVSMEEVMHIATEDLDSDGIVAQAILRLPLNYRQAILLKYSRGYDNREIAEILDCTVSKVEKLISRGKRKLADLLKEMQTS